MNLRRINLLYRFIRGAAHLCFHSIYCLKVEGRENIPPEGPAIILPKHQFWTDIPIVGLAICKPLNYIAKQELFVYPGLRHFFSFLGGIPIDRLNPVKSLDSFRYVEQLLQNKEFIVLFPEGTYYPHSMGRGKHRFIQRLLRLQEKMRGPGDKAIPFIPMGIRYQEKRLGTEVHVKIGKPLYSDAKSDSQEFTHHILKEIAALSGL